MNNMRTFTQWKQADGDGEVKSFMNYVRKHEALEKDDFRIFRSTGDFLSLAEEKEQGYLDTLFTTLPTFCVPERVSRVFQSQTTIHFETDILTFVASSFFVLLSNPLSAIRISTLEAQSGSTRTLGWC